MKTARIIPVFLVLLLLPTIGATQVIWSRFPASVFLESSVETNGGALSISHPAALSGEDGFHLWYTLGVGTRRAIGYAASADGMYWEDFPDNPVLLDGRGSTWDGTFVSQPTVLHDGRQFRMWYTGHDGERTRIGYATSADGIDWEKHAGNSVLSEGESGAWDGTRVSDPTVLYDGRRYRMWYSGNDGTQTRIGYATSADGISWEKPISTAVLEGNDGTWDGAGAGSPTVIQEGSTYRMWYSGNDGTQTRIGYAFSQLPGDIDGDGTISVSDAILILQYVVSLIDDFPIHALSVPKEMSTLPLYHVALPQVRAQAGQQVEVPVAIEDATGLYAGGLRVTYDPAVLQAVEATPRGLLNGSFWQANTDLPGEVRCAFLALEPLATGGNLFTLTFDVHSPIETQKTSLTLVEAAFNDGVSVNRQNGTVHLLPSTAHLLSSYPNPFNPKTTIQYVLPAEGAIRLYLYDTSGQVIRRLVEKEQTVGIHAVVWDGRDDAGRNVASGVYLSRLETSTNTATGKLLLVR